MYKDIFNSSLRSLKEKYYKGYDPYDILNSKLIPYNLNHKIGIILTQTNRVCPINFRNILLVSKGYNTKTMALVLTALLNKKKKSSETRFILDWLLDNRIKNYTEYVIGFSYNIILKNYTSTPRSPSLIITLFSMYAFIDYWIKSKDNRVLEVILSFERLIENTLPRFEDINTIWFSYNFEKENEIYNATAKVGKFYALLYEITNDDKLLLQIEKILNYLIIKQRGDGSWAYGEKISYTDGFHTAFVLEAIWHMRKVTDKEKYEIMYKKGLEHYKKYLFKKNGQPLYFHPKYKPKDIRRYLIETDIRDCAMAIVLFSKIGEKALAKKVLDWTIKNMYNHQKGYFYYYKNKLWTNKIEFIRWQAWMLYALSVYNRNR